MGLGERPLAGLLRQCACPVQRLSGDGAARGDVPDADALAIVQSRCAACHAQHPADKTFAEPPKGVILDTLEELRRHKEQVVVQAVNNVAMPLGNKTGMTPDERARLGAWLAKQ